jgi:hypothetical protein
MYLGYVPGALVYGKKRGWEKNTRLEREENERRFWGVGSRLSRYVVVSVRWQAWSPAISIEKAVDGRGRPKKKNLITISSAPETVAG